MKPPSTVRPPRPASSVNRRPCRSFVPTIESVSSSAAAGSAAAAAASSAASGAFGLVVMSCGYSVGNSTL